MAASRALESRVLGALILATEGGYAFGSAEHDAVMQRSAALGRRASVQAGGGREAMDAEFALYLDDDTVPKDSRCPTFASLLLQVDNTRWRGVPFLMTAGKGLDERLCEVRAPPPAGVRRMGTRAHRRPPAAASRESRGPAEAGGPAWRQLPGSSLSRARQAAERHAR